MASGWYNEVTELDSDLKKKKQLRNIWALYLYYSSSPFPSSNSSYITPPYKIYGILLKDKIIHTCTYMYEQIHTYRLLSASSVAGMYTFFRADHFVLDEILEGSFLGKTDSASPQTH